MRGTDETTGSLFSYVDLEDRIPARHPLRKVREIVNDALTSMDVRDPAHCPKARHSAIDGRTTRHSGYAASQKRRKKIEEPFGWAKTVGGMAQTMLRGVERVRARFTLTMAACNLARLPCLLSA